MTSVARIAANRANARKSTGPKTAAGKARVSRNARRHGLSSPLVCEGSFTPHVEALAREIAGQDACGEHLSFACNVAAAQLDLARIRIAKRDLQDAANFGTTDDKHPCDWSVLPQLERLDRYEQRVITRRRRAIREFCKSKPLDGRAVEPVAAVLATPDTTGVSCNTKPSDANAAQWGCAAPTLSCRAKSSRAKKFLQNKANARRCKEYKTVFDGMRASRFDAFQPNRACQQNKTWVIPQSGPTFIRGP